VLGNLGPMSGHALEHLARFGVEPAGRDRPPAALDPGELAGCGCIVAVDEAEHRPMIEQAARRAARRVTS